MPSTRSLVLSALLVLAPVSTALPQEPKLGNDWYQDEVDLGFKVKAPRDWNFVPGSPLEQNLIGKYTADNGQYVSLGRDAFVEISLYLVKFDRRPEPGAGAEQGGEQKIKVETKGFKDADEWMTRGIDHGTAWRRIDELKPVKGDLPSKVFVYEGLSTTRSGGSGGYDEQQPIKAYVAVFTLSPELDVALVGLGPGDKKKWRTYESAYGSFAKTVQPVAVQALAGATGKDPRSLKRAKLEMEVAKSPGWSLHETPNYFILSCYDDRAFIEELKLRLEGIRAVYEQDYPPEMSRKIKVVASHDPEDGAPPEATEDEEQKPDPNRTVGAIDALELGKCSVVRLCKDREQYQQYGGSQGTSGYFSPMEEELVVFDDKMDEGRDATWAVLNHEGFHQYIYAFFGNVSPHSWYNEGTGDYYSGFDFNLKTKRFTRKENIGRKDNLLIIKTDYVPLEEFVTWSKSQYYGNNKGNGIGGPPLAGWACYAQGWSLIWFLRTGGDNKAKGWKKEWGTILDKYLVALLETGKTDKALEKGFEGVDFDALEASWKSYLGI